MYSGVPPSTRFIYWNSPHPDADREREQGLRRLPTFIVLHAYTYDLVRDFDFIAGDQRYALIADILRGYDELFAHPEGVIVRRRNADRELSVPQMYFGGFSEPCEQ